MAVIHVILVMHGSHKDLRSMYKVAIFITKIIYFTSNLKKVKVEINDSISYL